MHDECYLISARLSLPETMFAIITTHTGKNALSGLSAGVWGKVHLPIMFAAIHIRRQAAATMCVTSLHRLVRLEAVMHQSQLD